MPGSAKRPHLLCVILHDENFIIRQVLHTVYLHINRKPQSKGQLFEYSFLADGQPQINFVRGLGVKHLFDVNANLLAGVV